MTSCTPSSLRRRWPPPVASVRSRHNPTVVLLARVNACGSPRLSHLQLTPICTRTRTRTRTRREYVRPAPLPDGPLTLTSHAAATPARRLIAAHCCLVAEEHALMWADRATRRRARRARASCPASCTCPDHSPPDHSPHQPRSRRYPGRGAASSRASSGFARRRRRRRSRSTASFARRCRCSAARLALTWASS